MRLSQRLAHHGASRSTVTAQGPDARSQSPLSPGSSSGSSPTSGSGPRTERSATAGSDRGFVHEVIEVAVGREHPRPAILGEDLAEVDLPTAPALAGALRSLARLPAAGLDPRCPAVMFDLETTGLIGQPGSLIGVAGAAWHVAPDRIRVEQWSLGRVGAEAAMLADLDAMLRPRVGPRCAFVTFNGASFDLPLLHRRLVRHGIYRPTDDPLRAPHVDLLPSARRLWRDRGPDCRLGTLEQHHLRLRREGDVGGAEVVELLWRWLEDPDPAAAADLARVKRHNRIDVLSLAALAFTMHDRLWRPVDAVERLRAARHHDRLGRASQAHALLKPLLGALARGAARGRGSDLAIEAGLLAAEIDRRAGRRDEAARLWARVCRAVPGHPQAHEALAKHLEHRARRPAEALAVAAASVTPCARRLIRLRTKAGDGAVIPPVAQVVDAWADPSG
ncbi:MAG: ribonuclease H-like domain-containing protein [Myxococcota bacterium]